jgi:hypothetical protein
MLLQASPNMSPNRIRNYECKNVSLHAVVSAFPRDVIIRPISGRVKKYGRIAVLSVL